MTALLDAVGTTIADIGNKLNKIDENDRPAKVIVLIITDGQENSSKEYTHEKIKEMIERQQKVYSWQFLFFGANIDSFYVAKTIGINANHSVNFSATDEGFVSTYNAMTIATRHYRNTGEVDESYKAGVV
jgi:ADP-heptose:LPS heptosyltransferase